MVDVDNITRNNSRDEERVLGSGSMIENYGDEERRLGGLERVGGSSDVSLVGVARNERGLGGEEREKTGRIITGGGKVIGNTESYGGERVEVEVDGAGEGGSLFTGGEVGGNGLEEMVSMGGDELGGKTEDWKVGSCGNEGRGSDYIDDDGRATASSIEEKGSVVSGGGDVLVKGVVERDVDDEEFDDIAASWNMLFPDGNTRGIGGEKIDFIAAMNTEIEGGNVGASIRSVEEEVLCSGLGTNVCTSETARDRDEGPSHGGDASVFSELRDLNEPSPQVEDLGFGDVRVEETEI